MDEAATRSCLVHATAVACGGHAVLLRGASGSGKSDLAMRLIAGAAGSLGTEPFVLVADDQVRIDRHGDCLLASPPPTIAGLIEVRGLGIVSLPHTAQAGVALLVDLSAPGEPHPGRLPEPELQSLLGVAVTQVRVVAFECSAPIKVALALAKALRNGGEGPRSIDV